MKIRSNGFDYTHHYYAIYEISAYAEAQCALYWSLNPRCLHYLHRIDSTIDNIGIKSFPVPRIRVSHLTASQSQEKTSAGIAPGPQCSSNWFPGPSRQRDARDSRPSARYDQRREKKTGEKGKKIRVLDTYRYEWPFADRPGVSSTKLHPEFQYSAYHISTLKRRQHCRGITLSLLCKPTLLTDYREFRLW